MPSASLVLPATILVADDDPAVRTLVGDWLRRFGMTAIEAVDGDQALALAQEHADTLDGIVLDVMMPKRDGFEVLQSIRDEARTAWIPVVLLTAHAKEDADIIRGAELLASDHIAKPFSGRVLVSKIRSIVLRARRTKAFQSSPPESEEPTTLEGFRVGDKVQVGDGVPESDEHLIGLHGTIVRIIGDGLLVKFDRSWESGPTEIMFPRELIHEA